jgi:HAD superfamily phosphatase (TIGR01668 family)
MPDRPHPLHQFRPSLRAESVLEISAAFLAGRGIRALILDLDNTLVPWHGREVRPEIEAWVKGMHSADIQLCIVSNTHRPGRLKELAALLGVQFVPSGGKPRRRGFLRAIEAMGSTAEDTAVIGDQVMTDIWGGNRCGLLTILVEPLSRVEFIGTRVVSRNVERLLLELLERAGHGSPRIEIPPAAPEETDG